MSRNETFRRPAKSESPSMRVLWLLGLALLLGACHDSTPPIAPTFPSGPALEQSGSGAPLHLQGSGIVTLPDQPDFRERSRFLLAGVRSPTNACQLKSEVTLKRGERIVDRIVEVDTIACAFLVARGDAPREALPLTGKGVRSHRLGSLPQFGSEVGFPPTGGPSAESEIADCGLPAADISRGRQRVYWRDPVFITVASDEIDLHWSFNFICAFQVRATTR